jgi:hypothetical protein
MAEKKAFLLRLNPDMLQELERWAADDFRSVNGQIESILHEAIGRRRKKAPATAPMPGEAPAGNKPVPEEKQ